MPQPKLKNVFSRISDIELDRAYFRFMDEMNVIYRQCEAEADALAKGDDAGDGIFVAKYTVAEAEEWLREEAFFRGCYCFLKHILILVLEKEPTAIDKAKHLYLDYFTNHDLQQIAAEKRTPFRAKMLDWFDMARFRAMDDVDKALKEKNESQWSKWTGVTGIVLAVLAIAIDVVQMLIGK